MSKKFKSKNMADSLPSDAELDALQAQINEATKGMADRATLAKDGAGDGAQEEGDSAFSDLSDEGRSEGGEGKTTLEGSPREIAMAARIEELENELKTLKDQALRAMADAQNIKKRSEREVQAAHVYGIEKFAIDMVSVSDNLNRALLGLAGKDLGENAKALVEGIELTEKDLIAVFARHGIKAVAGKGYKFDPNVHQAIAQIPSDEDKGDVAEVMQTGFTLGERTLRAAMVAVSTGPAKV